MTETSCPRSSLYSEWSLALAAPSSGAHAAFQVFSHGLAGFAIKRLECKACPTGWGIVVLTVERTYIGALGNQQLRHGKVATDRSCMQQGVVGPFGEPRVHVRAAG